MARPNRWVGLEPEGTISSGPHPWVRIAFRHGGFLIRHGIAGALTIVVPCVLWTVIYAVCFILAMFTGGGLGSTVSYPLILLTVFVGSLVMVAATLFPATALAERISRKKGWSTFSQIPLSIGFMALLVLLLSYVIRVLGDGPFDLQGFMRSSSRYMLLCLVPLGMYWWIAQSGPLLVRGLRRLGISTKP